ncbi:YqaA family protein [Marinomonas epiphytica]
MALIILFVTAFISATLFPLGSEVVLLYYADQGEYAVVTLLLVASVGNTLGSMLNWYIGRYAYQFSQRRWRWVNEKTYIRATSWFSKYGWWSVFFCWLPVVGDGIALVSGVLKMPLTLFLPIVFIGKLIRYAAVLYAQNQIMNG